MFNVDIHNPSFIARVAAKFFAATPDWDNLDRETAISNAAFIYKHGIVEFRKRAEIENGTVATFHRMQVQQAQVTLRQFKQYNPAPEILDIRLGDAIVDLEKANQELLAFDNDHDAITQLSDEAVVARAVIADRIHKAEEKIAETQKTIDGLATLMEDLRLWEMRLAKSEKLVAEDTPMEYFRWCLWVVANLDEIRESAGGTVAAGKKVVGK